MHTDVKLCLDQRRRDSVPRKRRRKQEAVVIASTATLEGDWDDAPADKLCITPQQRKGVLIRCALHSEKAKALDAAAMPVHTRLDRTQPASYDLLDSVDDSHSAASTRSNSEQTDHPGAKRPAAAPPISEHAVAAALRSLPHHRAAPRRPPIPVAPARSVQAAAGRPIAGARGRRLRQRRGPAAAALNP